MTVEIHIVRHGESVWNEQKRLAGWTDVALTELGRRQAQALRELLAEERYDAVWASDLKRAYHTAELAGYETFEQDRALREFHFGQYEGHRLDELPAELIAQFRRFESFAAPDGESGSEFYARIDGFFDALPRGRHLVFAHGGVVRSAVRHTEFQRFVANAGITRLDWSERRLIEHVDNPLTLASKA